MMCEWTNRQELVVCRGDKYGVEDQNDYCGPLQAGETYICLRAGADGRFDLSSERAVTLEPHVGCWHM